MSALSPIALITEYGGSVFDARESAGVEFIDENGGGAGVRGYGSGTRRRARPYRGLLELGPSVAKEN